VVRTIRKSYVHYGGVSICSAEAKSSLFVSRRVLFVVRKDHVRLLSTPRSGEAEKWTPRVITTSWCQFLVSAMRKKRSVTRWDNRLVKHPIHKAKKTRQRRARLLRLAAKISIWQNKYSNLITSSRGKCEKLVANN